MIRGCCGFRDLDCGQAEGDLIGHDPDRGQGADRVPQGVIDLMRDDQALHCLARSGELGSGIPHVAHGLADDTVGRAAALQLDHDQGAARAVCAQKSSRPTGVLS